MYLFSFSTSKWSPHDLKYESMSLENPPFESECVLKLLWTWVLEVKTWFCPLSPHCSVFTGSGILWFARCGLWSQRDRPHSVPMLRTKPTSMAARIPSLCLTHSCKGAFWLSWKHGFAVFLSKNSSCSYNTHLQTPLRNPHLPRGVNLSPMWLDHSLCKWLRQKKRSLPSSQGLEIVCPGCWDWSTFLDMQFQPLGEEERLGICRPVLLPSVAACCAPMFQDFYRVREK